MDNLSSHHDEGGAALEEWLGKMGMEFIYTPTYSPDLNPIEEYFSKIKSVLTSEHANNNVYSIKASVIAVTTKVTASDMIGYYRPYRIFSAITIYTLDIVDMFFYCCFI